MFCSVEARISARPRLGVPPYVVISACRNWWHAVDYLAEELHAMSLCRTRPFCLVYQWCGVTSLWVRFKKVKKNRELKVQTRKKKEKERERERDVRGTVRIHAVHAQCVLKGSFKFKVFIYLFVCLCLSGVMLVVGGGGVKGCRQGCCFCPFGPLSVEIYRRIQTSKHIIIRSGRHWTEYISFGWGREGRKGGWAKN